MVQGSDWILSKRGLPLKHQMRAAVVAGFGKPLGFRGLDIASPWVNQILVHTEAWGVCSTDVLGWLEHGDVASRVVIEFGDKQ